MNLAKDGMHLNAENCACIQIGLCWLCKVPRVKGHCRAADAECGNQGDHSSWKVMEFSKTIFQAWKVMENSQGHGKSWKRMMMSWNFL